MLELGDIWKTFGRGLALNLYEDQLIDFNSKVKGMHLSMSYSDVLSMSLIAGANHDFKFYSPSSDLRTPDGKTEYDLGGLELEFTPISGLWALSPYLIIGNVRSDMLWSDYDSQTKTITADTVLQTMSTFQSGFNQTYFGEEWDIYLEYGRTIRSTDYPIVKQSIEQIEGGLSLEKTNPKYESQQSNLYLQANWFPEWFTLMFEYKRYLNGVESVGDKRNPLLQASKPLPWQLGPTGIRQHDINILSNVTHPVDYGDELGWNLELRKYINDNWSFLFNASQTSQSRDSRDLELDTGYWPTQALTHNPWQEYYTELEYTGKRLSERLVLAYTRSALSGEKAAEIAEHYSFVPLYLSWHNQNDFVYSTTVELQYSRIQSELYTGGILGQHDYQGAHVIVGIDMFQKYSTAIIWDVSNDPLLNAGAEDSQHWVSGEISMKPIDRMWLRALYGKEKGGVRCTGGVCRVLNPFEGARLTLEWRL
jgi:hypothetical protein